MSLYQSDHDQLIRAAALTAIERLTAERGHDVPWAKIDEGFSYGGEVVKFASRATGIFKPRQMTAALSIKTVVPRASRQIWYEDQAMEGLGFEEATGLLPYNLARGGDSKPTNRALFESKRLITPLIYFRGTSEGFYAPIFPVWIADFDWNRERVLLSAAEPEALNITERLEIDRHYSHTLVRKRNHQDWFSHRVKAAYQWRCALSGLPVRELLVGAHIVDDSKGGRASVNNGICMSQLHHAAFDANLLGIDPKHRIHLSPRLGMLRDGPLLENLKRLDKQTIRLPPNERHWPRPDWLEQRFDTFRDMAK